MRPFKPWLLVVAVFLILILDFAALDDLTTGRELNFAIETAFLVSSIPALGILFSFSRKNY